MIQPPDQLRSRLVKFLAGIHNSKHWSDTYRYQSFFFGRNVSQVSRRIFYFYDLKINVLDQSIPQMFYLFLKTKSMTGIQNSECVNSKVLLANVQLLSNIMVVFAFNVMPSIPRMCQPKRGDPRALRLKS